MTAADPKKYSSFVMRTLTILCPVVTNPNPALDTCGYPVRLRIQPSGAWEILTCTCGHRTDMVGRYADAVAEAISDHDWANPNPPPEEVT